MLPPQWDIMAFVHSQSRRRLAIGKLIYVVSRLPLQLFHLHQHLLPPLMLTLFLLP